MERERPDALFVSATPFLAGRRVQLAQLAAFHRLPAAFSLREYPDVGGLMSYGANVVDAYRQGGAYTGRILKGAKPADLPILQSSKFELVINTGTARMLGLTVPASLLATAETRPHSTSCEPEAYGLDIEQLTARRTAGESSGGEIRRPVVGRAARI